MKCMDFLKRVWPDTGWYCVMTNVVKKDGTMGRRHMVFASIQEAYQHGRIEMANTDVYFGLHAHIDQKVFDQKYQAMRPSRKRENMRACRTFFMDMDVGKSKPDKPKYTTQADALAALAKFVFQTGLPDPLVVSSGYGVHVYWPLTDEMDSATWRAHAFNLKLLLDNHKVLYDPSRLVDTTSVLRMPSTFNHKDKDNLQQVMILHEGDVTDTQAFADLLANLTKGMQPIKTGAIPATNSSYVNIVPNTLGFPPTDPDDVAVQCEQVRIMRDARGVVPEHHWYPVLGVLAYCTNGEAIAHQWSSGYPGYTYAETQAKMDQWRRNASVPGCGKFMTDGAPGVCQRCPHFGGQYKNPIVITNKQAVSHTAQFVQPQKASLAIPGALCDPPWPYRRIASLGVEKEDAKGVWKPLIPNYDLYPVSVSAGIVLGLKINPGTSAWVVRENTSKGIRSTIVEMAHNGLSDPKVAAGAFAPHNVFIPFNAEVAKYMSAYLQALKAAQGERPQHTHLGWPSQGDVSKFILNGKVIDNQGNVTHCVMSNEVDMITMTMTQKGTLNGQVDTLAFYDHPNYRPFQFAILSSLASPLLMATGHHGVVVHLTGQTGTGKTMAMKAAAGLWGDPTAYIASGTDQGMTTNARNKRAMAIPNLPMLVDEITHAFAGDMRDLVMQSTQGNYRITLTATRQVREHPTGFKSSTIITSGNTSLNEVINKEDGGGRAGTANSARVIEIVVTYAMQAHSKNQGDLQLKNILKNFGWIGEEFMKAIMPHMEQHFEMVNRLETYLNARTHAQPDDRFPIACAAAVLAAGVLARHHGFITWDIEALADWFCDVQLPAFRQQMSRQAASVSPENVMREFIAAHVNDTITADATANIIPPHTIRNQVVIHHATDLKELWISVAVFKSWCNKRGMNVSEILDTLSKTGVVTQQNARKVLGLGTAYGRTRTIAFVVDAAHPSII